jgi:predicted lipoprotein with Yx(FWY)xxD motif
MRVLPRSTVILSIAMAALVLAACRNVGSGSAAPSSAGAGLVTLTVSNTDAGAALAGEGGMTLYVFTEDTDGTSTCTGGCANTWLPLLSDGSQVTLGDDGISGTFGTTTRDDGTLQVTHDGQPLYYFSGDDAAGDSNGDGVYDSWFIAPPGASASQEPQSEGERPSATPYRAPGY